MIPPHTTPTPTFTTPLPIPPTTTKSQATVILIPHPSPTVLERLLELEKKVEALSKVDHSEAIEESVQANIINEVKNHLPKFLPKAVSDFVNPRIESIVRKVLQKILAFLAQYSFTPSQSSYKAVESLSEYELKKILFDKMDKSRSYMTHDKYQELYDALLNSIMLDEAITSGDVDPDKKRRKGKDSKPFKDKVQNGSSSKGKTQSKPSSTNKPVNAEEPLHEAEMDMDEPILSNMVNEADYLKDDAAPTQGNSIWFKQPSRPPTPDPEKYIVSITETKAARYELELIEEMIPKLWSPVKVAYDKDAALGISKSGPMRQLFYKSQINRFNKHDVYSTVKILSVVSVKVDKQFGYDYLQEIGLHCVCSPEECKRLKMSTMSSWCRELLDSQKGVEDVQLGVESYYRKLNITPPQKEFSGISTKNHTPREMNRQASEYIMVQLINKQLLERRIMRSLEGSVGGSESALAFAKVLAELEVIVMRMVAKSLGIEQDYEKLLESTTYIFKFNKYLSPPGGEKTLGAIPHTDKSFMTIIQQHEDGKGLEIKTKDGVWIEVEFKPSSFIVMAGDVCMAWSNGRIEAPTHRVMMEGHKDRISLVTSSFIRDLKVEVPQGLVNEDHPLKFKPFDHYKYIQYHSNATKVNGKRLDDAIKFYCRI
uniref:Probable 2-oxoglutarate-dependent dioxygenase AOP1 n=1 Tax=Tanacetum cinerariifolium TaxID=118510 RepID=A0A6L2P157_TANCI|nr:probable 2-oxoglutarate-dependent dioxygenase AOP1 [Tanacetum cinerariifolium]